MKLFHWVVLLVVLCVVVIASQVSTAAALPFMRRPLPTPAVTGGRPSQPTASVQTTQIPSTASNRNFKVRCGTGQVNNVDPIVMPGMPAMSHYHQFFGNRSTDENSTFESLRANRATSCNPRSDASAYWVPELWLNGVAIAPKQVTLVYSKSVSNRLVPHPAGLKLIAGSSKASTAQDINIVHWACSNAMNKVASTPPVCGRGADLVGVIRFPECWNGVDLDSEDHKSHVMYASNGACPAGTVAVPRIEMQVRFPGQRDVANLALASGSIYSWHADLFTACNERELGRLVARIR
ncbi:MAG: DUF1996 domain-containing protein [Roseiflexaceae bacterium]